MEKTFKSKHYKVFDRVVLWVVIIIIVCKVIPIEFSDVIVRMDVNLISSLFLVAVIVLWIVVQLFKRNSGLKFVWSVTLSLLMLSLACVVAFLIFMGQCVWEDSKEVYVSIKGNEKIRLRMLNCGATTDYSNAYFYVKSLNSKMNLVWKTDTNVLNKQEWEKVK